MGKKIYAVRVGRTPGFYYSWEDCQAQTKGFPKAAFKGFDLMSDAQKYMAGIEVAKGNAPVQQVHKDLFEDKGIPPIEEELTTTMRKAKLPQELTIYTDGSGLKKDNTASRYPGGYAVVFLDSQGSQLIQLTGGDPWTTNNKMELTAVKEALQHLDDGTRHKVCIKTDSKYIVNSFNQNWVKGWINKSTKVNDELIWHKSNGEIAANQDLMKEIDRLRKKHEVIFEHVQAHVGTKYNELCDQLAKSMAKKMERARAFELRRRAEDKEQAQQINPQLGLKIQRPTGKEASNGR